MAQLKVVICGAGIAGNALAFWLSKLGYEVTVVERWPNLRATGLQVDLRGFGVNVLKRMGLEQAFRARTIQEQGLEFINSSGEQKAYFPANRTGKGLQSFTTDHEIMRGDLCRLLYDATKDRVKYVFGVTVESFEENNTSVEVLFSNGKKGCFDLLVGADGQWSRIRRLMLGPDTPDPFHFLGVYTGYFTIPQPIREGEQYISTNYIAPGKRMGLRDVRRGSVNEEKAALAELFQGAGWQTDRILKGLMKSDDFYLERLGLVKTSVWSQGRVVLIGDAAYCPSAVTGMGTTSSLVGAYILAGEIGQHCGSDSKEGLLTALKQYEQCFRPFMDKVQKGLSRDSNVLTKIPSSPVGIALLHFFLGLVALLRLDVLAKYIIREDVREWDLPEYQEMIQRQE
ncbi:FAD/NAD(P)-binding domain-containing protein [Aspergillus novofumigatus IBT 16806]|uniref:FAD/NAD(P)-binding domain-containing protein n=1 Tax=Aspergillus novofumigatus (strain IBT 16806) TaxID=1392255 RepID=A0A2I1C167_ASPN1|nr:FAD/NAD(P)-binding domain-containing protein [Aspergillus novofumigatus IBT 16806]PKX91387.1 FAD/NAD(P)-binding domain-containing protein [Aspergillus novofumigatus IBT 16806]